MNMFVNFSIPPLRLSGLLGFLLAIFGLALGAFTVVERALYPDLPTGWSQLMVAVSVLAGAQLLAMSMIGGYVGRIFLSLHRKPQYTIRERYEADDRV